MKLASLLLAALLLASGCSTQVIQPSYYLLRPGEDSGSRALEPASDFALGNVIISSYIDQPGLLLETESGEMRPARHHLWAEPMYEGVRNYLLLEISRARGRDIIPAKFNKEAALVDIRVDQFHGTFDGRAKLVAFWWLRHGDEVFASYKYSEERTLAEDGYAALAAAEKALLTDLAEQIAGSLVAKD